MKIFNKDLSVELEAKLLDLSIGYLKDDKLFVQHHDAILAIPEQSVEEQVEKLQAQGKEVELNSYDGLWYETLKSYPNGGKTVRSIKPIEYQPAKAAYDEYENIQVYIPYTEEELEEQRLTNRRAERVSLLAAFDKWEKAVMRGREEESEEIMQWYYDLLDLKELAFENVPERVKYYL